MLRQDYIMRMIEQLVRVLAQAAGLNKHGKHAEALLTIDQALQQLSGLDSKLINSLPVDSLIVMLKIGESLDADRCIMVADLLTVEAEVYEAQDQLAESYQRYLKSLHLFLAAFLSHQQTQLPHHFSGLEVVVAKLELYELPLETKEGLWQYWEEVGQYARAEDLLYELLAADQAADELLERGIAFYRRLLQKPDNDLNAGNLPRDEVEAGLAELIEIKQH